MDSNLNDNRGITHILNTILEHPTFILESEDILPTILFSALIESIKEKRLQNDIVIVQKFLLENKSIQNFDILEMKIFDTLFSILGSGYIEEFLDLFTKLNDEYKIKIATHRAYSTSDTSAINNSGGIGIINQIFAQYHYGFPNYLTIIKLISQLVKYGASLNDDLILITIFDNLFEDDYDLDYRVAHIIYHLLDLGLDLNLRDNPKYIEELFSFNHPKIIILLAELDIGDPNRRFNFNTKYQGTNIILNYLQKAYENKGVSINKVYELDLEYWLSNGIDINAEDSEGRSLLFYAVAFNSISRVRKLLHKGANMTFLIQEYIKPNTEKILELSPELIELIKSQDFQYLPSF